MVTANCEAALRRLRGSSTARKLWIDAICINQADLPERSHQVSLMSHIYRKARQVIVWLGEDSVEKVPGTKIPLSQIGMGFLISLCDEAETCRRSENDPWSGPNYRAFVRECRRPYADGRCLAMVVGLRMIFRSEWWERVWVIQEVALASSALVIYGTNVIDFSRVVEFASYMLVDPKNDNATILHKAGMSIAMVLRIQGEKQAGNSFGSSALECVNITQPCSASDPRDKVFAILALMDEEVQKIMPRLDYGISVAKIYVEVSASILKHGQSLDLLYECRDSEMVDMPSWTPDWSTMPGHPLSHSLYKSSGASKVKHDISVDNRHLKVSGCFIDKVREVKESTESQKGMDVATYDLNCIRIWRKWCHFDSQSNPYPTGKTIQQALWRTILVDVNRRKRITNPSEHVEIVEGFSRWCSILNKENSAIEETRQNLYADTMVRQFFMITHRISFDKTLCVTTKGNFAMVPKSTQSGDLVALFAGARLPFVLRPSDAYFKVIGPCYVHGVMDGEAFPENELDLEWITLC